MDGVVEGRHTGGQGATLVTSNYILVGFHYIVPFNLTFTTICGIT